MAIGARINQTRFNVFRWRYELSVPKKLVMALGMALLVGLIAQARIQLPWSPVPLTGQTFGVLLAGVLLGRWWGGVSLAIYGGLGMAGVPWFTGMGSGLAYIAGPTGGYIIGFIAASLFLGHFTDKYVRSRSFLPMLGLMLIANFVLIYVPGLIQLGIWLNFIKGAPVSLISLLSVGAIPFIAGDVTKAVLAAVIARGVTPGVAFDK
jgi:biotin transport system substrate-specific component